MNYTNQHGTFDIWCACYPNDEADGEADGEDDDGEADGEDGDSGMDDEDDERDGPCFRRGGRRSGVHR